MKIDRPGRRWTTEQCPTGKRGYFTRASAKDAAKRAAGDGAKGMRPYACPDCDRWHIGHKPARVIRGEVGARDLYANEVRLWLSVSRTGLWCSTCALPSGIEFAVQRDPAEPATSWTRRCGNDSSHRIDGAA